MSATVAVLAPAAAVHAQPAGWEVRVPARLEVPVGDTATLAISIAVDRGLAVSKDAPVIVDLVAAPGISVKKTRLSRADAVDPGADAPRFAVAVRGDAAGEVPVALRIRLWLCGGKACRPVEARRRATIAVLPAVTP